MMSGRNNGYPFTPSQWQELENQAQIYKHMVQGIPIPTDLLIPIKRSFSLGSPFATQTTMGWSCYQMGYGRKIVDPEPGRCRRTDGKKWRCSKEAYPDSKYCERHMHRGKNRSRKPVEISIATNNNNNNNTSVINISASSSSFSSSNPCLPLSISMGSESHYPYPLMYPQPYQPQNNASFSLDSGPFSSSADRDYRYFHGMKDVDGYSFMSDSNVGERGSLWELRPLGLGEPKVHEEEQEKNKHCFVLGADFKLEKPVKERDFFDEWPHKNNKGSWMGLEGENSSQGSSYSKTNLSISIPKGLDDFP